MVKNISIIFSLMCILTFNACEQAPEPETLPINTEITAITSPCELGGEGNLFLSPSGQIYLSWLEYTSDTSYALNYAQLEDNDTWSMPKTIATGDDWFVNWADFPSFVTYEDEGKMAAHWLQMSADGTYDYDVMISQSMDHGETWGAPIKAHSDNIAAEHGFVSMIPVDTDKIFATWLDGRNTKQTENTDDDHGHGHGHGGAMTLRSAIIHPDGNKTEEVELDNKVCDCCQTSATQIGETTLVAYRNRTDDEVRDIAVVRKHNGKWSSPNIVYNDNWVFPACPVNGPVIESSESMVAVAWYTMNDTIPEVKVAFSNDHGKNFDLPIRVDQGSALGRVDLAFINEETVLITWIEKNTSSTDIMGMFLDHHGNKSQAWSIVETSAKRSSGFPRMVFNDDRIVMCWTEVLENGDTKVKTSNIKLQL